MSVAHADTAILVVGNDAHRQRALRSMLEPLSVTVVAAQDGEECLRQASERDFAAALIELEMVPLDGLETIRQLGPLTRATSTPLFLMTRRPLGQEERERVYEAGAADVISEPFQARDLLPRLRAFVDAARMVEAARTADRARAEFMSLAAHELRGPLGVSYGYVTMLQDGTLGRVPPDWEHPLEIVAHKLDEMNGLLEDLFLTARMDSGQVVVHLRSVDLGHETRRAVDRVEARAALLGAEVTFNPPPVRVRALADPGHLARILDNLINNGLHYSGDRPCLSIEISDQGRPRVSVTDKGAGVPEEMRERIFERAIRYSHPSLGSRPGTGLGLYLSRRLAHQLGGEVTLEESEVGAGSRFAITLLDVSRRRDMTLA